MMDQNNRFLFGITAVLAFCSIVYELVLAQALAAFFENTVLRYSVTIGLYMFAMGCGALLAEGRLARVPELTLQRVELGLTMLGASSVLICHVLDFWHVPRLVFLALAHLLIIVIGVLTGLEIPLLMAIAGRSDPSAEHKILAVDYLGALAGTVCFAFVFYPRFGLIPTTFLVAGLNALAGVLLARPAVSVSRPEAGASRLLLFWQAALLAGLCAGLIFSVPINEFFIQLYLN